MLLKLLSIPIAIVKDVITLGGGINDGYFQNGNRTYTGKILNQISAEVKLKEDIRTVASITKELKKLLIFIVAFTFLFGCSSLRIETHPGWFSPTTYELTDGELSVRYYNGDCCCIAKQVLEELQRRVNSNQVDWKQFADKQFADEYLRQLCNELKEVENSNTSSKK